MQRVTFPFKTTIQSYVQSVFQKYHCPNVQPFSSDFVRSKTNNPGNLARTEIEITIFHSNDFAIGHG